VYSKLGIKKVATIHDGSPYAEQLGSVFAKSFEGLGGQVVAREAVNVGDTDMRPVLTRIKTAGPPELIYWSGFVAEGGLLATQKADVGMQDVKFMGADGINAPEFIKAAGAAAEGMYSSAGNPAQAGAGLADFTTKYEKKYGEKFIGPFHAHTYDAYMVIAAAIDKVAVKDGAGNLHIPRKALRDAVRSTDMDGISGKIKCDQYGDCGAGVVAVFQVKAGVWALAQ